MKDVVVWTITSLKMYQIQTEAGKDIVKNEHEVNYGDSRSNSEGSE